MADRPSPDPAPRLARRGGRALLAITTTTVIVTVTACGPADEDATSIDCATAVEEAAEAAEVGDTVRLLDTALAVCRSYGALTAELARYPGIIGYDTKTFVELRCSRVDDESVRSAPSCSNVISPTSTVPVTAAPELVFVGDTLDGRQVEIRPGPNVEFVGDVPAVVQQTVDIAFEAGCEGVIAQRDEWAAQVNDPRLGDFASVYAQHAQNVAAYIGCDVGGFAPPTTADGAADGA